MKVIDIMTKKIVAVHADDTLEKLCEVMQDSETRHLIVMDGEGQLAGIISDRDCTRALQSPFSVYDEEKASDFAKRILAERIMTKAPQCVSPHASIQEAAYIMTEKRINALPVTSDTDVIGIVTSTDLLKILASMPEMK